MNIRPSLRCIASFVIAAFLAATFRLPAQQSSATAPIPHQSTEPSDRHLIFSVATIKPDATGGGLLKALHLNGHRFHARNASLLDLIKYAYNLNSTQIENAPEWAAKTRFDVEAVSDDTEALTSGLSKEMLQHLLAQRFALSLHRERRDLKAFALKPHHPVQLQQSHSDDPRPSVRLESGANGVTLGFRNATMKDFTDYLQAFVLDRPVVNATGLEGRNNFTVLFMPDDSQFGGRPPQTDPSGAIAPSLFTAIEQTLGLRLSAQKAEVDILMIDHVEMPSEN